MGVLNSSRKAMKGFIEKSYSMGQLHGEMKKINDPRRQNLIETVHLTKAEENKIDTLFVSTYGKKIMNSWGEWIMYAVIASIIALVTAGLIYFITERNQFCLSIYKQF